MSRLPPLLGLALVVASCSGERPPSEGRLQRLALQRVQPRDGPEPTRLVRSIAPGELRTEGAEGVVPSKDGLRTRYTGRGLRTLLAAPDEPDTFDPAAFNQVVVRGVFAGPYSLELRLSETTGEAHREPPLASVNQRDEQALLFDLSDGRRLRRRFDRLELLVDGPRWFELTAIELYQKPLAAFLPDPDGEPALISFGSDARLAVGIAAGDPLECTIRPERGDVLAFCFGVPAAMHEPAARPILEVAVESGSERERRRFPLTRDSREAWNEVRVPLGEFVGGETRVRFELREEKGLEAHAALAELRVARRGTEQPTVVLITSDTHRADHLGAAGAGVEVETPAVDALAERGVLFERCWSTTNVTSPSHIAMLTATHPRDTRVVSNTGHVSDEAWTLAEVFRDAGWHTYGVVSVRHLGPLGSGLGQGFDRMYAPVAGTWPAGEGVDKAIEWVEEAEGLPVFLWLHVFDAHHPYAPPEPFDRYYYPKERDPFDTALPPLEATLPEGLEELRDLEFPKSQYRAEVTYLDHELGRLLSLPRVEGGVTALTADHGEVLEKGGLFFTHAALYPDTLHVPLVLAWPGAPAGTRVARDVQNMDLARTLLDLAGLDHVDFPGRDLLADGPEEPRFALSAHGHVASVTVGGWHYVLHLRPHKDPSGKAWRLHSSEIYALDEDPECLTDLSEDEHERASRLRSLLVEWLVSADPAGLSTEGSQSVEALRELAALGYATAVPEVGDAAWFDSDCDCEECEVFE